MMSITPSISYYTKGYSAVEITPILWCNILHSATMTVKKLRQDGASRRHGR